ncbi:MAG: glycosyltransferase family 39 protein [Anaerolineae bacterium]|nr:glycosyltransferase family 39 protein [Anaerolineae bacterium]
MNKYRFWLLLICFIALALRLYNLTYHSLWFDEAISVHWARQSVPRILEVGLTLEEDRLPPLYYLLLKGWTGLVGFSETGVRSLSVLQGTLLVAVIAAVAKTLFNRRVALLMALLVALNPFLIWYAQEARMYAQAALFSALTVWAFLQMASSQKSVVSNQKSEITGQIDTPHAPRTTHHALRTTLHASRLTHHASLFTLFALAGLYTHLYTGFILPALGLWLLLSYPRRWRLWLVFALCGLVIALAFAPLALATWRFSGEAAPGDPLTGLPQRAWGLLQAFTLWKAPLPMWLQIIIPAAVSLFALTAYAPRTTHHVLSLASHFSPTLASSPPRLPAPRLLASLLLASPFVIASLLLLRNHLAFFGERYFIVMVPWLLLLAAVGAERISEWANGQMGKWRIKNSCSTLHLYLRSSIFYPLPSILYLPSSILLLLLTFLPLPGQWTIPAAKEAWRQSVAYLAEHAAADHGILIHPDWVRYPFQYYFRGPGQTYAAFSNVSPATALDGPLQGVVGTHPVIWLIQSHLDGPDPQRLVEQWFAARYPLVTELYPPGISLKGFAPGYQLDSLPPEVTPAAIEFSNGLKLAGYQADAVVTATDDLFHPPSGWVHVTLYWTAARPITQNVTPGVNLVGPEGVWGASLDRTSDALKLFPPSRWVADQIIRHDLDVNLNPITPPGHYQLVVSLPGSPAEQYPLTKIEVRR